MMLRSWVSAFYLSTLLGTTSGCFEHSHEPLRIGINAWPGYEFLYLAQVKGFYREEGLEIKLLEFSSLSDARRAYERGQIDGLGTSVIDVLQARDSSTRSPQIVQVIDYSDGADMILARPDIPDIYALRGRSIAVEIGSLGVYVLARGLELHDLSLSDVNLVSMDQISMEEAISKGTIDAIVSYPPTSIKLLRDATAKRLFASSEIAGEVFDVIAVDEQVIDLRSADVAKLLHAYQKAILYTQQYPDEAYQIMSAREGITSAELHKVMINGMHIVSQDEQADYLRSGGKLEKVIDITDRILRQTNQIKGPDRRSGITNNTFALNQTN